MHFRSNISTDLSRRSDTFPDTEVAEHPADQKTQSQLPSHTAQLLNASRHGQHPPSEGVAVLNRYTRYDKK